MNNLQKEISAIGTGKDYEVYKVIKKIVLNDPEDLEELNAEAISKLLILILDRGYRNYKRKLIGNILKFGKHLNSLQVALLRGDFHSLESLLENGEKPEGPRWYVESLVRCIFRRRNLNIRKDLLLLFMKYGLDTGFHKSVGESILHLFIENVLENDCDAAEIAKIIIDTGIPVNEGNTYGYTPLIKSIPLENLQLISVLIENGAIINVDSETLRADYPEDYPLIYAAQFNNTDVINLLLSNGADINIKSPDGWTALHETCWTYQYESMKFLLLKGADITAENIDGETPFAAIFLEEPEDLDQLNRREACVESMVREIAKLFHKNLPVSKQDIDSIKADPKNRNCFELCTRELQRMVKTKFYPPYSYEFVFKATSNNLRKLANLTNNKEFVKNFKAGLSSFTNYKDDLQRIFNEAIQARDASLIVYSRLYSIFGHALPDLILRKLTSDLSLKDLPLQ